MADAKTEIQRLRRELNRLTREMEEANRAYNRKLTAEVQSVRQEYGRQAQAMERDLQDRFAKLEDSICSAYLHEVQDMRTRCEQLQAQTDQLTKQLQAEIDALRKEQSALLEKKEQEDAMLRTEALDAQRRLQEEVLQAMQLPIDIFYPHKMQIYLDAGDNAEKLLREKLFSISAAQYESALLGVKRLENDTRRQMTELLCMFQLYQAKLDEIDSALAGDHIRQLKEQDGTVILDMSDEDLDYWSDCLFGELLEELAMHRAVVQAGTEKWIEDHVSSGISPATLLDRQMQRLDAIPKKLNLCVSYAMSACDSFNCLIPTREKLIALFSEQNYRYTGTVFGKLRLGKIASEGFTQYKEYLSRERCRCEGTPDYREERIVSFQKNYPDGTVENCHVIFVPVRSSATVSCTILLLVETDRLPQEVERNLEHMIQSENIPIHTASHGQNIAADAARPMDDKELERLSGISSIRNLQTKYSV